LRGQFLEPRKLSDTGGQARQCTVGVDLSFNAYVVWTAGQELFLDIIGVNSSTQVALTKPPLGTGDPTITTNYVGTTFIAFTQDDPHMGGREVFLLDNFGGTFSRPAENLSRSIGDDYAPKMALDSSGQPHVVWAQRLGDKTWRVLYRAPGRAAAPVASGDYPAVAVEDNGTVHIVYSRGKDIFAIHNRGGSFGRETAVTRTPLDEEFFPSVAVAESGAIFVGFERRVGLYYHESPDGGNRFGAPRLLDSGGVTTPELRVVANPDNGDILTIVYEKEGDIFYIQGIVGGTLLAPVRVAETTSLVETRPSLGMDPLGSFHVAYILDGEVYYTNNAGTLTAEFIGTPTTGEVPLRVQFADLSRGKVLNYRWDFGDGSPPSNETNPVHIYANPGKYTVKLEVFGLATEAAIEKKSYIFVQTPNNRLWIPDQLVLPSQSDVWYPVMAFHTDPLQGLEVVGTFDASILTLKNITYQGTALDPVAPEFFEPSYSNGLADAYFYAGVIFDWKDPFNNQTLPPWTSSSGQRVLHLVFDVSQDAPQGGSTLVELKNGVGPGALHNVFAVSGVGILPVLRSSTTEIYDVSGPALPQVFRRGDVDWSRDVDLTDAISVLSYLFLGGQVPRCLDAADFDDNGNVDIADAINLLAFSFLGGAAPMVPFPGLGLDPSEDGLPQCRR